MPDLANVAETPVLEQSARGEYYYGKHPFVCGDVIRRFWPAQEAPRISLRFASEPSEGSVPLDFRLGDDSEDGNDVWDSVWWSTYGSKDWCEMYPALQVFLTRHLLEAGAIRTLHVSVIIHEEAPECSAD